MSQFLVTKANTGATQNAVYFFTNLEEAIEAAAELQGKRVRSKVNSDPQWVVAQVLTDDSWFAKQVFKFLRYLNGN